MILRQLLQSAPFIGLFVWFGRLRARDVVNQIERFLPPHSKVLDIGCGPGFVAEELSARGHQVSGIDLPVSSVVGGFNYFEASAYALPFEDKTFDYSIMHTALHHMERPELALHEARRVSDMAIVGEELRVNGLNWFLLRRYDALINLELFSCEHSNKTHEQWLEAFHCTGFELVTLERTTVFGFIQQVIYVLRAKP